MAESKEELADSARWLQDSRVQKLQSSYDFAIQKLGVAEVSSVDLLSVSLCNRIDPEANLFTAPFPAWVFTDPKDLRAMLSDPVPGFQRHPHALQFQLVP